MAGGRRLRVLVVVALAGLVAGGSWERLQRRWHGVAPGVTLEGRPIGGLLEHELRPLVERMAASAEREPVDATVDPVSGQVVPERPGVSVDVDETVKAALRAEPGERLALVRIGVRPRLDAATLARLRRPLGVYVTWLFGSPGRRHNIELAARAIHNTLLLPGRVFSFNDVVGERTWQRGYRPAPVIVGEAVGEGLGGGICQVASTLYNAALRAGLTVVERHRHSLSPRYVPEGQDATVNWPDLDLKLRNDLGMPVLIQAQVVGASLVVRILGPSDAAASPPGGPALRPAPRR